MKILAIFWCGIIVGLGLAPIFREKPCPKEYGVQFDALQKHAMIRFTTDQLPLDFDGLDAKWKIRELNETTRRLVDDVELSR